MKKQLVFLVLFWSLLGVAYGQTAFEKKVYVTASGDSLNYRLLRPEVEQEGEKYPLVLFLHGAGERGSDNEKQLFHGSQMWLNPVNREEYPAFVLFPQCPESGYWAYADRLSSFEPDQMPADVPLSSVFATLKALLDTYLAMPQVDKHRIYVFGISEGGYGSQSLASFYADYWAGAGPMAGGEPLINAPVENLAHVPLSFLTGDRDFMFYRHLLTKTTGEKLDSMQHIHPNEYKHRVDLIPGMGHSIDYTPTTPWLAQHKRNAQPRHFIWENLEMDGLKRNAFYNLQVLEETDAFRTQYEFTANGDNSIDIKVDAIKYNTTWKDPRWGIDMLFSKDLTPAQHGRLRIYLSDTLADLGKKVTIRINGKEVFHGKVKSSKKTQKQARELWNDPMRDFKHAVEVNW